VEVESRSLSCPGMKNLPDHVNLAIQHTHDRDLLARRYPIDLSFASGVGVLSYGALPGFDVNSLRSVPNHGYRVDSLALAKQRPL